MNSYLVLEQNLKRRIFGVTPAKYIIFNKCQNNKIVENQGYNLFLSFLWFCFGVKIKGK